MITVPDCASAWVFMLGALYLFIDGLVMKQETAWDEMRRIFSMLGFILLYWVFLISNGFGGCF